MATLKQKKAIKDLSENLGKPIGKAMRDAGYSKETSETPKLLTESKAWSELMEEQLPDANAFKAHREALEATKQLSAKIIILGGKKNDATSQTDDFIDVPDHAIRLKAAELQYKLKGKLTDKAQIDGKLEFILVRKTHKSD